MFARWSEEGYKTFRGTVLPTNVHDQLATGRKLRVLTVVDTFSRDVPVPDVRYSYRGEDVVATRDRLCRTAGYPQTIRVDQGTGFVSRDMNLWAYQRGVVLDVSRTGNTTDNAFILRRGKQSPGLFPYPSSHSMDASGPSA